MSSDYSTAASATAAEIEIDTEKIVFKNMERPFTYDLLKKEGDFLLRRGGRYNGIVLSVHAPDGKIRDFRFLERRGAEFFFPGGPHFRTLNELLSHYYGTGEEVPGETHARLNNLIQDDFDLINADRVNLEKKLGGGNLGEVWRAKLLPDNETVAVRILLGNTTDRDRIECRAEARIMSWLNHENVVKVRGIALTTTAAGETKLVIVNEYCKYGSLKKWLEEVKLDDKGKALCLFAVARGIRYLHRRNIIHTDIACRNCLLHKKENRKVVKIGNFALTRMIPDSLTEHKLPLYSMPWEALRTREWTEQSDVWAFGVLMLEVHNKGRNPYEQYFSEQRMDLRAVIRYLNEGNRIDAPTGMPPELYEMAEKCMDKESSKRPDMDEVVNLLKNYCNQHFGAKKDKAV